MLEISMKTFQILGKIVFILIKMFEMLTKLIEILIKI